MDSTGVPQPTTEARFIVESLEHPEIATLEDRSGARMVLPRAWLPSDAGDGDVVRALVIETVEGRTIHVRLDPEATAARRREMQERRDRLPRGPGGSLDL